MSSKENDVHSTPTNKRPAMSNDVFSSPITAEMMLSPPPEEELRYTRKPTQEPSSASKPFASSNRSNQPSPAGSQTSKRKRTITGASVHDSPIASPSQLESAILRTPNPRLRKQVRHAGVSASPAVASRSDASPFARGSSPTTRGSSTRVYPQEDSMMTPTRKGKSRGRSTELVPQSPYASNPSADYIPPAHLTASPRGVSVRRRSVTPIPPYEPPKERYTPPREIVVSPPAAERKPARRTVTKKKRVSVKSDKPASQLRIKTEPPEIDLTKPAPPASPSEDPILLVGPPSQRLQRPSASPNKSRDPASLVDFEMELDIPESERRATAHASQTVRSSSSIPPAFDFSNLNDDDGGAANNGWTDSSSDLDYGNIIDKGTVATGPGFDDAGWSDSDDDNGNGEDDASIGQGDFTGRFLAYSKPVKLDPPAGEARDRMEEWARPISPHPKKLSFTEPKEEDVEEGLNLEGTPTAVRESNASGPSGTDQSAVSGNEDENANDETQRTPGYQDKRGRRLTLSEVEAIRFGSKHSTPKARSADKLKAGKAFQDGEPRTQSAEKRVEDSFEQDDHYTNYEDSMHMDNNQLDTSLDDSTHFDNGLEQTFDLSHNLDDSFGPDNSNTEEGNSNIFTVRSTSERSSGESSQSTLNNADLAGAKYDDRVGVDEEAQKRLHHGGNALQEDTMKRSASLLRAQTPPNAELSGVETELEAEEGSEDNSDEGAGDVSVIKIMSDDPMAAARAAAILKMHDYDMVARKLRRRKTAAGGISKGYSTPKKTQLWRRRTVAGLSAEDDLAGNVTLPELLVKAEEDLRNSPMRSRSRSGSVALSSAETPQRDRYHNFMYENAEAEGIREWTKADWKVLDSCFTDERYDFGEQLGLEPGCLADVDDIPLEVVVERFVETMGGAEKVEGHGPSWTSEKLMGRAKALCKRQRSGNGAPPTPDVSMRFSTPPRFASPSMIVPDFTPSAALFESGSVNRKTRLPPPSSEPFFKVPSTVPARHSRLRDEVSSAVPETPPKSSRALGLFGFATPVRNGQEDSDSDDESVIETMLTPNTARIRQAQSPSAVKRSLSYISSWLKPDMYKSKSDERKESRLPGLPVPPEDLLSRPRGPVETPAPKAAAKAVPPKELVSLDHVPLPVPSKLPRASKPRRLVDLQHVPTPQPKEEMRKYVSRRSSTSSVRDLVKEFEEKDKAKMHVLPPRVAELRRQASVGSLKSKGKPAWRP